VLVGGTLGFGTNTNALSLGDGNDKGNCLPGSINVIGTPDCGSELKKIPVSSSLRGIGGIGNLSQEMDFLAVPTSGLTQGTGYGPGKLLARLTFDCRPSHREHRRRHD
jgi:hypothetical protein